MKKDIRLYNVIFPIWILMFWPAPPIILATLFGNLAIDYLVLLATLHVLKHPAMGKVLSKLWWKFWGFGFLADMIGAGCLFGSVYFMDFWHWFSNVNIIRPWANLASFLWTLAGVAIAGVCIYLFDRLAMKNCELLDERQRHLIAFTMAVVTAPWLFLVPLYW